MKSKEKKKYVLPCFIVKRNKRKTRDKTCIPTTQAKASFSSKLFIDNCFGSKNRPMPPAVRRKTKTKIKGRNPNKVSAKQKEANKKNKPIIDECVITISQACRCTRPEWAYL